MEVRDAGADHHHRVFGLASAAACSTAMPQS